MEASFLTQIALPVLLALIMFGMGLSLTRQDFARLWKIPRPVFVGLFGQLILLPLIAFAIALLFGLRPDLAIGLMILSACPGGTTSNVISHMARANLALSVTLTAITTVVCVFSTPFIIKFAISFFEGSSSAEFSLFKTSIGLMVISLCPVLIGILVRAKFESFALRTEDLFRRFSAVVLFGLIAVILIQERANLANNLTHMFWGTVALNLIAVASGVALAKCFKLSDRDGATLGIEVGIQNSSLALLIAVTFLQNSGYAISPAVYGITMYIGAIFLVILAKRRIRAESEQTL